jgi:hypothetical protein
MRSVKLTTTHKVALTAAMIGAAATFGAVVWNNTPTSTTINNQGIVTQGQSGGTNTVINRQPARHFDDALRGYIRANVPKSKAIKIMVLNGDPERDDFADEIIEFLKGEGYDLKLPAVSFLVGAGKTPNGVEVGPEVTPDNGTWVIKVGVNTR